MKNTFNENSSGSGIFKFTLLLSLEALVGYFINAVDIFMVGRLGETSIAAVGIANQFFYLLTFVFVGICNSSIIFAAQFWGKKDVESLYKVMDISMAATVTGAFVFHLPVYWVMLLVVADEITKMIGGLKRFFSTKWITNLVSQV